MPDVAVLREAALSYARMGWRVFPVRAGGKEPATEHGVKDASTDESRIAAWWATVPYNIGMACGPESGVFVIDVDPRNGGEYTDTVNTARARSGGGGDHYYYLWPAGVVRMRKTLKAGVDVQGEGKYVLVAPSETTGAYAWVDASAVAPAPPALLAEVALAEGSPADKPGDRFNREHTLAEIIEPHGWKFAYASGDETYWTRPGKDEGVSATWNYQDSGLFWVFSSSTGLEQERGYDLFGLFTALNYDGDFSAAAAALATPAARLTPPAQAPSPVLVAPPSSVASPMAGAGPIGFTAPSEYVPLPLPADHLLQQYITYMGLITDASPEYHEAVGLSILGVLTSGMRVSLSFSPDGMGTNLYIALVGPSSVARKSTAMAGAVYFLNRARPNALLPDRSTGEALISELAARRVAVWMPDEFGLALTEIYQRGGFLQALEQLLLTLYGSQTYRYQTQGGGETMISGLDLSLLGAGTPESFASAGPRALATGLLPRVGIVFPEQFPASRPPTERTSYHELWADALAGRFSQVLQFCLIPGGQRVVTLSPEAFARLATADVEFGGQPLTARLTVAAYKIAALLAIADGSTTAGEREAVAALCVVRRWAAGAVRLRRHLGRATSDEAFMEQVDAAREVLRRMPGVLGGDGRIVVPERFIARELRLPGNTIDRIRKTLEMTGEVVSAEGEWHIDPH